MNLFASSRVRSAKKFFATAALTVGIGWGLSAPVQAQVVPIPCEVYLCMAGISGEGASGGPGCTAAYTYWVTPAPAGLAVYAYGYFIPPASYALREAYMEGCAGGNFATNAAIFQEIMDEWGYSQYIF